MNLLDKKELIEIAKNTIFSIINNLSIEENLILKKKYSEKRGLFVTLKKNNELRGCIGFIHPIYSIYEGIKKASIAAAFEDPRFEPLRKEELNKIKYEISILSIPKKSDNKDIEQKVRVGYHGIIIKKGLNSGLLLPQVAEEYNWNSKEFLEHTCIKAGINPKSYKEKDCEIYLFHADIFSED
jgi:AmmeMemoRadiSam system protein A